MLLVSHVSAAPTIVEAARRVEIGADGPGDPGFSDRLDTAGLDRFNERVLGSGTVNGGFFDGQATQISNLVSGPEGVGFTAIGRARLSAEPSSEADRFAGIAVSTVRVEVELATAGEIELFYNMSSSAVPPPGQPAMFATASVRVFDLEDPDLPTVFHDVVDGSVGGGLFSGDAATLAIGAGRYHINLLAVVGVFQGSTQAGTALLPADGIDLSAEYSVGVSVIPAPAAPLLTPAFVLLAARRRCRPPRLA